MTTWNRLVMVLLLVLGAGCKHADPPEQVLTVFLDQLLAGERAAAWEQLSTEDRAAITAVDFAARRVEEDPAAIQTFDAKTTYVIKEVSTRGNASLVTVAITTPDAGAIIGGIFGAAVNTAMSGEPDGLPKDRAFIERLQAGEPPMHTFDRPYDLQYQDDRWRVVLDVAAELADE